MEIVDEWGSKRLLVNYEVVTAGGVTTTEPLRLLVEAQTVTELEPLALGETVSTNVCEWLAGVTNGWSVTGLPAGLAYAAKNVYGYKNAKKKTGKCLKQAAQTIVGTPTKPGTYIVTFTKNVKSGKKTVKKTVSRLVQEHGDELQSDQLQRCRPDRVRRIGQHGSEDGLQRLGGG